MISEYQLIRKLLKLKTYHKLKKNLKKKLLILLSGQRKKYKIINFTFNEVMTLCLFNHIIALFIHFNHINLDNMQTLINDYNCYLISQMPIFTLQAKNLPQIAAMQKFFEIDSLKNQQLRAWILAADKNQTSFIAFINDSQTITASTKNKINNLCHVSGCFWNFLATTNNNNKADTCYYNFGYLFMLNYLIFLESKQTIKMHDKTDWNLNASFQDELEVPFFLYYLKIIDQFSIYLKKIAPTNFNLYFRVINVILNKTYE